MNNRDELIKELKWHFVDINDIAVIWIADYILDKYVKKEVVDDCYVLKATLRTYKDRIIWTSDKPCEHEWITSKDKECVKCGDRKETVEPTAKPKWEVVLPEKLGLVQYESKTREYEVINSLIDAVNEIRGKI